MSPAPCTDRRAERPFRRNPLNLFTCNYTPPTPGVTTNRSLHYETWPTEDVAASPRIYRAMMIFSLMIRKTLSRVGNVIASSSSCRNAGMALTK
ncbi:MAG: hypothetical protein JWQ98_1125 [Chlorobi bacterium]|nr:hypothetical protein [Chlorobiota bacterium]